MFRKRTTLVAAFIGNFLLCLNLFAVTTTNDELSSSPLFLTDYPAAEIVAELEFYLANGVNPKSEAKSIVEQLIEFQKEVVRTNESALSTSDEAFNIDLSNSNVVYHALLEHFVSIGKAEHIQRALYSYRLAGAPDERTETIKSLLTQQTSFIEHLYSWPKIAGMLKEALKFKETNKYTGDQVRMIDAIRYDYAIHTAVPDELAARTTQMRTEGRGLQSTWKNGNVEEPALEWLEEVFDVQRQVGQAMADELGLETAYDGVLALFQPGYDSKRLDAFFDELIPEVQKIADEVIRRQASHAKPNLPEGPYDLQLQAELNELTASVFDIDRDRYHLSFSDLHSLEGGLPGDVRLVVSLSKSRLGDFVKSNRSTIHEVGHGLYIDSIPTDIMFTPLGKLMGTGVEEGMAFLTEKMITRSRPYAEYIAPHAKRIFDKPITIEDYFRSRTWVERSLVRIAADEVTYPLHPFIRMQIERDLINGKMEFKDFKSRWNELYKELLGVEPDAPKRGFLQDAQWYAGKVGMFPFYTLGDAIAAQIWFKMREDLGDLDQDIRDGDLSRMRLWLEANVFEKGRYLDLDEFMIEVTGEPLSPRFLIDHLKERYLPE